MRFFKLFKNKKTNNTELLILYGTKSGNSKLIAQQANNFYKKKGLKTECENIASFNPHNLLNFNQLLLIVSTHGEGEPPPNAKTFYKICMQSNMVPLNHLSYSICALGDSSYKEFCWAGKILDKRLNELGATRFCKRTDCDENFSNDAISWIKASAEVILKDNFGKSDSSITPTSLKKEYIAKVTEQKFISSSKIKMPSYHISLDISNLNLIYNPGDSIEILPKNPLQITSTIAQKLQVYCKLIEQKEITSLSLNTLKKYNNLVRNPNLDKLLKSKNELREYLSKANFYDVLNDFTPTKNGEEIIQCLPELKTRKYSIASSKKYNSKVLDLTIKTIRYSYKEVLHEGAASVYTNETLAVNSLVKFKHCINNDFKIPNGNNPIIMIGVSTGIAVFRALLQECKANNDYNNYTTWLIYGNKNKDLDFLYENELKEFKNMGVLNKISVGFSKDTAGDKYVQDIIIKEQEYFKQLINKGALVYVCGSIKMGKSVSTAINDVLKCENITYKDLVQNEQLYEDLY